MCQDEIVERKMLHTQLAHDGDVSGSEAQRSLTIAELALSFADTRPPVQLTDSSKGLQDDR